MLFIRHIDLCQARYFKQNGMIYVARNRLCFGFNFEGLPPPPDADFSLSWSSGSLSDWKERLWIGERGDDWEKQFVQGEKVEACLLLFALIVSRLY